MHKCVKRFLATVMAVLLLFSGNVVTWAQEQPQSESQLETKSQPQDILAQRRDMAEQHMRKICSLLWRCEEDIYYSTDSGVLPEDTTNRVIHLQPGRLYQGMPYSYGGGSLDSFMELASEPDEKGIYSVADLNWQMVAGSYKYGRFGNDCSGSVCQSWSQFGTSVNFAVTSGMTAKNGYLRVGDYTSSDTTHSKTDQVCAANGEQTMYAAYAQAQKADAVVHHLTSETTGSSWGHVMMTVSVDVVYNEDGTINGEESVMTILEQTTAHVRKEVKEYREDLGEDLYWICGVDIEYTFAQLYKEGYLPITCKELVDPTTVAGPKITDSLSAASHGYDTLLSGTISTNHWTIDSVQVTITDTMGKVVQQGRATCPRENRYKFSMSLFKTERPTMILGYIAPEALTAGNYHCNVVLRLSTGEEFTVRDYDFSVARSLNDIHKTVLDFSASTVHDCPACGSKGVQWSELTTANLGSGNGPAPGHYYLAQSMLSNTTYFPLSGGTFCLYLNNCDITSSERVFYISTDAVLNVMGKGTLTGGATASDDRGATFDTYGGTLNLFGGTYKHQKIAGKTAKPIIGVRKDGVVNLYDGAEVVGTAGVNRTNVLVYKGRFNMYGGKITDGYGTNGANVLVGYSGTEYNLNYFSMFGGEISNGNATDMGGNIYGVYDSMLYIHGGTVSGGTAVKGGNIAINKGAHLYLNGGTVTGGTATESGSALYGTNVENRATGTILADSSIVIGNKANLEGSVYTENKVAVRQNVGKQDVRNTFICPCSDCVAIRKTDSDYTCPEKALWKSISTTGKTTLLDGGHYYVGTDTMAGGTIIVPAGAETVLLIDNCTLRYQGTSRMLSMNGESDNVNKPNTLHLIGNNEAYLQSKYTSDSGTDGVIVQVGAYETSHLRIYGDLTIGCEEGSTAASSGGLIKIPTKGRLYIHDNENMGLTNDKDPLLLGHTATSTSNGGGAVYIQSGSGQFNMEAGTIRGGSATYGGAVYVGGGTCNISGSAKITGSTASYGGGICVADGTLNLNAGTVSDCEATKYGGGVYTKGGKVYIGCDTAKYPNGPTISNCSATTRGGGMYIVQDGAVQMDSGSFTGNYTESSGNGGAVYIRGESDGACGTFSMSGGTVIVDGSKTGNSKGIRVQGGVLNLSGTATVIAAGKNEAGSGVDCISSGQITLDGAAQVYTPEGVAGYDILFRNSGTPLLTIKEGWTGKSGIHILKIAEENSYAPGAVLGSYAVSTGNYTGTLYLQNHSTLPHIYGKDEKLVFSDVQVCTGDGSWWCRDNAEALLACNGAEDRYIKLFNNTLDMNGESVYVDFNGQQVNVTGSGILYGFDSGASADSEGTAAVTATGVELQTFTKDPVTSNSFVAVTENNLTTFHMLKVMVAEVSLRPDSASMYYGGKVICDKTLAAYITSYGIAVQLWEMPGRDFTETALYSKESGSPLDPFNGVLIANIMKENADNSYRADMPICANAYVTVSVDGQTHTYLSSDTDNAAFMSLKTLIGYINTRYDSLGDIQKTAIGGFYTRFKSDMSDGTWKIHNIQSAVEGNANDNGMH